MLPSRIFNLNPFPFYHEMNGFRAPSFFPCPSVGRNERRTAAPNPVALVVPERRGGRGVFSAVARRLETSRNRGFLVKGGKKTRCSNRICRKIWKFFKVHVSLLDVTSAWLVFRALLTRTRQHARQRICSARWIMVSIFLVLHVEASGLLCR